LNSTEIFRFSTSIPSDHVSFISFCLVIPLLFITHSTRWQTLTHISIPAVIYRVSIVIGACHVDKRTNRLAKILAYN